MSANVLHRWRREHRAGMHQCDAGSMSSNKQSVEYTLSRSHRWTHQLAPSVMWHAPPPPSLPWICASPLHSLPIAVNENPQLKISALNAVTTARS